MAECGRRRNEVFGGCLGYSYEEMTPLFRRKGLYRSFLGWFLVVPHGGGFW